MAATYNYEWNQGEDMTISLVYKSGPEGDTVPVDLTSHLFRMDIVAPDGKVLSVLNDSEIEDTDPFTEGDQGDTDYEVILGDEGEIVVELSRALTLPGGPLYPYITAASPTRAFLYDMFLRDSSDKQRKILGGTITVVKSVTQWL